MAEGRQQQPKPQQAPSPPKMGDKPSDKPRKLTAPSLARETSSAESDQMMKTDMGSSQSDEGMGHIGKKKYRKTWSPLKGTKWSDERRALRGGKKWRAEQGIIEPGTIKKAITFVSKVNER